MIEQSSIQTSAAAPLLRVEEVSKSFGGVHALRGVDLDVLSGEVHALLGENGAGKSTLIKILSGVLSQDGGAIRINGRQVDFRSPAQSRAAGVAVVYQDLSLVESLSVAANLLLGREPHTRLGFLKKRDIMSEAEAFLRTHGIALDPKAIVNSLPFAYRQMTEIAKALMGDVKLLVLDEPTSALTGDEERILFDAVRTVTSRGVGVIYVTHRLKEVFQISQRVTVFRDGVNVGTFVTADTDMKQLVGAIVGSDHAVVGKTGRINGHGPTVEYGSASNALLELKMVGNERLKAINLTLHRHEIHGIAGLIGSGRTEILETIFGILPRRAGEIRIDGTCVERIDPALAIELGIALVPEDRHLQGLVLEHSIERNLTLPRLPAFSRLGWLRKGAAGDRASSAMRRLAVKAPGPSTSVKSLSGGNQQKVVFAKWNDPQPKVLLLDEPTVGVDVGAREEIYDVIRASANAGAGVLLVSSDVSELIALCDRISVMVDGRIVKTVECESFGSTEDFHHLIQLSQSLEEVA